MPPSIAASTLAEVGAASSVAGAGIGAIGAIQSGAAASASARYNAEIATQNQTIANQNATLAGQAGEQQAAVAQQKNRAQAGGIKAAAAASGIDVNSGSALDVRSSAAELGELNVLTLRSNAARAAFGYETQAVGYGNQSQLDIAEGQQAVTAAEVGAGSTILGGVGSAAARYGNYLQQSSGGFNAGGGSPVVGQLNPPQQSFSDGTTPEQISMY